MWSITLKLMRKTKRMLIPAGIAIMIGTAFIASTFLFGNAMNDSLTRQMTAMFGNANYAVTVNSSDLSDEELNEAYSSTVGSTRSPASKGLTVSAPRWKPASAFPGGTAPSAARSSLPRHRRTCFP